MTCNTIPARVENVLPATNRPAQTLKQHHLIQKPLLHAKLVIASSLVRPVWRIILLISPQMEKGLGQKQVEQCTSHQAKMSRLRPLANSLRDRAQAHVRHLGMSVVSTVGEFVHPLVLHSESQRVRWTTQETTAVPKGEKRPQMPPGQLHGVYHHLSTCGPKRPGLCRLGHRDDAASRHSRHQYSLC